MAAVGGTLNGLSGGYNGAPNSLPGPLPTMSNHPPRSTIADVARHAGVSKATVSRFLNHRDTLLSPEIAQRVEAAIRLGQDAHPFIHSVVVVMLADRNLGQLVIQLQVYPFYRSKA